MVLVLVPVSELVEVVGMVVVELTVVVPVEVVKLVLVLSVEVDELAVVVLVLEVVLLVAAGGCKARPTSTHGPKEADVEEAVAGK